MKSITKKITKVKNNITPNKTKNNNDLEGSNLNKITTSKILTSQNHMVSSTIDKNYIKFLREGENTCTIITTNNNKIKTKGRDTQIC